ncbi:MAG: hypothetical protein ABIF82_02940 [Planctomycetota bacterium]
MVYKEVDHAGNISVGMTQDEGYKAHCEALKKSNVLHARAYIAAEKAWDAETEYKDLPFPLKRPARAKCIQLKRSNNEWSAKEYLNKLEALRAKLKERREKEQNSLAPAELSEAERKTAERRAALLEKATTLFNEKLKALSEEAGCGS